MTGMPSHARKRAASGSAEGRVAAWLGLVTAGSTTVTFNIWHATHSGMPEGLGIVEGVAPVALAMIVSHLVATYSGGKMMKAVTFAVMVGAMTLSVGATGAVVHPAARSLWPLFGAVIDTAALACLQVLLSLRSKAAREAAELAAEETARAEREAAEASELPALRAEVAAWKVAWREAAATAAVDREAAESRAADAERIAAGAVAKAEELTRKLAGNRSRKRGGTTGRKPARKPAGTTGREEPAATVPVTAPEDAADLDAEALVLKYLAEGMSASAAGRKAGLSDGRGRQIARKLAKAAPEGIDPGTTS